MTGSGPHRVVVIGAGFGGLFAARRLKRAPVEVTVIDQTTHHLFQPLLYQAVTSPRTTLALRWWRRMSRVAGAISPSDSIPVATCEQQRRDGNRAGRASRRSREVKRDAR
jgi:2-polyprenyl-6-methoxyphenol hydroxylase-like FAD-dependent oxidoreductase